jgi:hypothetical protein
MSDADRTRRVRGLFGAMAVCDALVIAIVAVGLAVGWPVWVVVLAALFPLVIGAFAVRMMYILRADRAGPAPG